MRAAASVLLLALAAAPAAAQGEDEPASVNVHPAYAADHGFGEYEIEGRSVQVYRIPFAYQLRDEAPGTVGWKLTLPVSFGVHRLFESESVDEAFDRVETYTLAPGFEMGIVLPRGWDLRPFAEVGYVSVVSGGGQWVYTLGLDAGVDVPGKRVTTRYGGGVEYSGSDLPEGFSGHFFLVELGAEVRFPLGFEVGGHPADLGLYGIGRRFKDLEFARPDEEPLSITGQGEIGLTFGTEPRWHVWGLEVPRIGIGYRFGEGLKGYRINFGFPF